MPEDKTPEDECDLILEGETQKERLAKNRFYNPELDQGDPTPQWMYEIQAFVELGAQLIFVIVIPLLTIYFLASLFS
ncbi:hypothetical protein FF098_006175 [Parvularcula flava]|uniref:Uncharacterized protein n=1 Tax=Aquisalinus luteolus TaxID=1566827 RepID=A0A8J3A1A7_9PROT|nr:hypothetical protein [Aquisalinus luteolus]NHK27486.1 hypothetical protein [Aquisalinus luteolus]GGH95580.1 hypothetical protein GCM10011355_12460 [Aquisalinus luteolus]